MVYGQFHGQLTIHIWPDSLKGFLSCGFRLGCIFLGIFSVPLQQNCRILKTFKGAKMVQTSCHFAQCGGACTLVGSSMPCFILIGIRYRCEPSESIILASWRMHKLIFWRQCSQKWCNTWCVKCRLLVVCSKVKFSCNINMQQYLDYCGFFTILPICSDSSMLMFSGSGRYSCFWFHDWTGCP